MASVMSNEQGRPLIEQDATANRLAPTIADMQEAQKLLDGALEAEVRKARNKRRYHYENSLKSCFGGRGHSLFTSFQEIE
jgi:hypothetical protein